jgi:nucleoside-diphosphate kinase
MVWEGPDVIRQGRKIIGATNPNDADPGSIRGLYCLTTGRNAIHGSDSYDAANVEIPLWFKPSELLDWKQSHEEWILSSN